MSVAVATMGKFWPSTGTGTGEPVVIDTGTSDGWDMTRRRPVVELSYRSKKKKKVDIKLSLRGEDEI